MKIRRTTLAVPAIAMSLLCALFVSGAALNDLGLNYSVDSSAGGFKLHPYTMLAVLSLLSLVGGSHAFRRCLANRQCRTALIGAVATGAILVCKALLGDGTSLGFAVDTIVAAFLIAAVLPLLPPVVVGRLSIPAAVFIVVECVLAIVEAIAHTNVIPVDAWYGAYFRSTALQGHPLNNALILVTVATASQACARARVSASIFVLCTVALVAFGARGALAIYLAVNLVAFVRFGMRSAQRALVLLIGGVVAAVSFAWLLLSGALGDRIAEVGVYDSSSAVRLDSLAILNRLGWSQLVFGSGAADIGQLMGQADVGVIENFLVGYLLSFGAIFTAIIFYCVYRTCKAMLIGVERGVRRRLLVVAVVFVLTALTNNSLITKTPALYLLMVGLWYVKCRLNPARELPPMIRGIPT